MPNAIDVPDESLLGPEHKSLPPAAWGRTVAEFLATSPRLSTFATPLLTLDRAALDANVSTMADWAAAAGVALAPHGKTSMSPRLWNEQLRSGAWGITLATGWQVQLARRFSIDRIMLADALVDPVILAWLGEELDTHPEFEFVCWADSVDAVAIMDRAVARASATRKVTVLVELGAPGGRTGARSLAAAEEVAAAIAGSERLALGGVAGYEGALAHTRTPEALAVVAAYLDDLAALHRSLAANGMYPGPAVVTAGGSAYPDVVAARLSGLANPGETGKTPTEVVIRSGAYLIHDDGFYADISPLAAGRTDRPLRAAMHGWARVLSRPEPELAILDAGKRDLPFDEGLPVPQRAIPQHVAGSATPMPESAVVTALNDQHTFLRNPGALDVGSVVRLGLSHPCTALDKWRLIPVIDSADSPDPIVVDLLPTYF